MSTTLHRAMTGTQVHVPHFAEYATKTAREADITLDSTHVGKIALQMDDGSYWRLVAGGDPPQWQTPSRQPVHQSGRRVGEHGRVQGGIRRQHRQQVTVLPGQLLGGALHIEPGAQPDQFSGGHRTAERLAGDAPAE